MNNGDRVKFNPLPKEEEFSSELTEFLNKNVNQLVTPEEESAYEFSICIASSQSPLKCIALTNNKFRGILKVDLRRKVFKTLKT